MLSRIFVKLFFLPFILFPNFTTANATSERDSIAFLCRVIIGDELSDSTETFGTMFPVNPGEHIYYFEVKGDCVGISTGAVTPFPEKAYLPEYNAKPYTFEIIFIYQVQEPTADSNKYTFRSRIFVLKRDNANNIHGGKIHPLDMNFEFDKDYIIPLGKIGDIPELSLGFRISDNSNLPDEWFEGTD